MRVPFTPEEDSFIRKGIKKHGFGHWTEILRSFRIILEAVALLIVSRKEQKSYLANKNSFTFSQCKH